METWVNELRVAILLNAVDDYHRAVNRNQMKKARELTEWFLSEWAEYLSWGLGQTIINRVLNGGVH